MMFFHYDNFDRQLGVLKGLERAVRTFSVTRNHTMDIVCATPAEKADRVVFRDPNGVWHEYYVLDCEDDDSEGHVHYTYDMEWSMQAELIGDAVDSIIVDGTAAQCMQAALDASGSRWKLGNVDVGSEPLHFSWYHMTVWQCLREVMNEVGAELEPTIVVEGGRIVERRVNLPRRMGRDRGKRFVDTRDLESLSRSRGTDVIYTRICPLGAAMPIGSVSGDPNGGYSRKITIGEVNGGDDYLADEAARERWGRPDGKGGKAHVTGFPEFENVKEKPLLLEKALEWFRDQLEVHYSYTATVVDLSSRGLETDRVYEGDDVALIVGTWDDPVRIKERVVKGSVDYLEPENTEYTIGTPEPGIDEYLADDEESQRDLAGQVGENTGHLSDIDGKADGWDETADTVANAPGEWLRKLMSRLNQEFDAAKTYKFSSFEKGDIWANGPLTEDGKPTGGTDSAINLNGMGFRIASEVENGDFKWTVFGTGKGFTASLINVGTLRCGDNYLNLDTGEMRIALTAKVGTGQTDLTGYVQNVSNTAANNAKSGMIQEMNDALDDYIPTSEFDSHLTMHNVASALTNGFVDKGLFIDASKNMVMFNGDYIRTGVIESQNGMSFFDLNNGYLEATGSVVSVGQRHTMRSRLVNGQLDLIMDSTTLGSLATYTNSNNANVHVTGLKAFTTLVLSGPELGVSSNATTQSGITWDTCISGTINHAANVTVSGSQVTIDMWASKFIHGLLCSQSHSSDVSFGIGTRSVNLVASVDPVELLSPGDPLHVVPVTSQEELIEAAEQHRMVWVEGEEAGTIAEPVYTGSEWTTEGIPQAHQTEPIVIPLADYVDAQADAMQSEIEALADALEGTVGTVKARALKARIASVRTAMGAGEVKTMRAAATVAGTEEM